jgi:tetratricopeptide (TPR) repeat protein
VVQVHCPHTTACFAMSFRFFRRIRLAPGLTLNLSKTGASLSAGPRGAQFTVGTRGTRATVGLPGTGLYYTVANPLGKLRAATQKPAAARVSGPERPTLGFFQRLTAPAHEKSFVDGLAALHDQQEEQALQHLERAAREQASLADAAWLAGVLRLQREELELAEAHLQHALRMATHLGQRLGHYGLRLDVTLPVTAEVNAQLQPNVYSTRLALIEIYQLQGRSDQAMAAIDDLLATQPHDPVALASYGELALDTPDPSRWRRLLEWSAALENDSPVHTVVMLYRGLALLKLGMDHAAESVFTLALRRTKDRSEALLNEIRYQRALVYERTGKRAQAQREFERLYAADPTFEDVAHRIRASAHDAP